MSLVMKADASAGDAYVTTSFAAVDEVWVTVRVGFFAAARTLWTTSTNFGDLINLVVGASLTRADIGVDSSPPDPEYYFIDQAGQYYSDIAPGPEADEFHTIELHWNKSVTEGFYYDGTLNGSLSELTGDQANGLILGLIDTSPNDPDNVCYFDEVKIGTTRGGAEIFSDDFESGNLAAWDSTSGDASVVDDPFAASPPAGHRFRWRYVITNRGLATQTFLDGLATARKITYTMNKAAVAVGTVPADSPEVNIPNDDGDPFVEEGIRFLLAFREEGFSPRWQIRFAGIIMQLEDNVDEAAGAAPYTNITAYDPWQYLYARPVRTAGGDLLGPAGLVYTATPANQVVTELLSRTQDPANDGNAFIDPDAGTVEVCDPIDITFQQGTTVGEAWDQLCQSGFVDIILTPIYAPSDGDPDTTKIVALNVYASPRARIRRKAIFAWDMPSRSLSGLNRLQDGTQRANRILYHTGQGGQGVGVVSDGTSQARFGDYWAEQFFPGDTVAAALEALANEELLLRKNGVTTYRVNPVVGSLGQIDSPVLFFDYFLGDQVPVYASRRIRRKVETLQRVYEIPVEIRDDGMEQIAQMTFSADGLGG